MNKNKIYDILYFIFYFFIFLLFIIIKKMISRVCLVNNFGFFTYLKDRYNMEKVFHLLNKLDV